MGAYGRPVRRSHYERVLDLFGVLDGAAMELDVRVLLELTPPASRRSAGFTRSCPSSPPTPWEAAFASRRRPPPARACSPGPARAPRSGPRARRPRSRRRTAYCAARRDDGAGRSRTLDVAARGGSSIGPNSGVSRTSGRCRPRRAAAPVHRLTTAVASGSPPVLTGRVTAPTKDWRDGMRKRMSVAVAVGLLAAAPATTIARPPTGTPPTDPTFQGASFCSLGAFFAHEAIDDLPGRARATTPSSRPTRSSSAPARSTRSRRRARSNRRLATIETPAELHRSERGARCRR